MEPKRVLYHSPEQVKQALDYILEHDPLGLLSEEGRTMKLQPQKNYTITICTNNETLRGSRSIDDGLLDDACVEACNPAADIYHERISKLPVSDDCFDLEINGTFADWNGGRMSGDQYFRVQGAQKHGYVVIKCDDIDAEIPQELVTMAEAMHKAISDSLDEQEE